MQGAQDFPSVLSQNNKKPFGAMGSVVVMIWYTINKTKVLRLSYESATLRRLAPVQVLDDGTSPAVSRLS